MTDSPFDLKRAHLLAQVCNFAYQDALPVLTQPGSPQSEVALESLESFSSGAACGFAARLNGDAVLVFRGTVAPHVDWDRCLIQWLANLSFGQMAASACRVHQGFHQTLDQVWEQVLSQVRQALVPSGQLWVTGHSLGGALAMLAAARL